MHFLHPSAFIDGQEPAHPTRAGQLPLSHTPHHHPDEVDFLISALKFFILPNRREPSREEVEKEGKVERKKRRARMGWKAKGKEQWLARRNLHLLFPGGGVGPFAGGEGCKKLKRKRETR